MKPIVINRNNYVTIVFHSLVLARPLESELLGVLGGFLPQMKTVFNNIEAHMHTDYLGTQETLLGGHFRDL